METKKQLEKQKKEISEKLWTIEAKEKIQTRSPLVGTYAKYRNSSSPEDKWWMYRKYTHINESGILVAVEFQTTNRGSFDCSVNDYVSYIAGWSEITKKEFVDAWKKQTKEILSWV